MPATVPRPPSGEGDLRHLRGAVQTRRPNREEPFGIPWANVARWEPFFTQAGAEFDVDPFFMGAMTVIESDGNQYWSSGVSGERSDVVTRDDGFGAGLSVGLLQVKPAVWQRVAPDADRTRRKGTSAWARRSWPMPSAVVDRGRRRSAANTFPPMMPTAPRRARTSPRSEGWCGRCAPMWRARPGRRASGGVERLPRLSARQARVSLRPRDCRSAELRLLRAGRFCYRATTGREIPGGRGSWLQCHQAGRELGRNEPLRPGTCCVSSMASTSGSTWVTTP